MISVVMPVWNRENLIKESIESVLAQTYKDFELVIVDDGSTDKTKEIVKSYKDKRIKLIEKEHSGATKTYNRGLKEAKGDFICILGSDDLWMQGKLEKQIQMAKKYPNYVLHTNAIEIDERGELYYKTSLQDFSPKGYIERAMQPYAFYYGSSLWIPKKILDKVGLFPESINQDYYWVLKAILLHNVKFKLVPEYLVKKRQNPKSTTGENKEFILKEAERIRKEVISQMREIIILIGGGRGGKTTYAHKVAKEKGYEYISIDEHYHYQGEEAYFKFLDFIASELNNNQNKNFILDGYLYFDEYFNYLREKLKYHKIKSVLIFTNYKTISERNLRIKGESYTREVIMGVYKRIINAWDFDEFVEGDGENKKVKTYEEARRIVEND